MVKTYLAYSGGKDSTALALAMPDAIPVFTDTGWEFPELYEQLDKFEQITKRKIIRITPDETIPEYIARSKFLPGHMARFCTRIFKIEQYNNWLSSELLDNESVDYCIGLRSDEPKRIGNKSEITGVNIRYPLQELGMNIWDVIRICTEYDLLPRFPSYMARGGCIGCYYKRKSEIKAMHYFCPDVLDRLQTLEEGVQDYRSKFAIMFPSLNRSIRQYRIDIDAQQEMFDVNEVYAVASDRSHYGENCGLFCGR